VYAVWDGCMEVTGAFLFKKMQEFGWEVYSYSYNDNYIDLYGGYPRSKVVAIKKFFYDNYPFTYLIEPRKYGLRIYFKIKVNLVTNLN
jgi:hypothetical protein